MFFVNFKNYPQAFEGFPKIYQDLEAVVRRYSKVQTIFAPPLLLLARVVDTVEVPLWAQHLDSKPLGKHTGFFPPEAAKRLGTVGTFLNHSEHPLSEQELAETVTVVKEAGLSILIFAANPEAVSKVKRLSPNYIAYEPPELVGGKISVTTARVEIIPEAVEAAKPIPLIVGAGIHKGADIEKALELGATGGAASSAIVTAPTPAAVLDELLSAF